MTQVYVSNAVPKNLEWWGLGREIASSSLYVPSPGTITNPSMTVPLISGAPNDTANMLVDKALRGDMGEDYNEVVGVEIADFPFNGNVYLDSIGHLFYNLFGDYSATGTTLGSSTGTVTGALVVGANGATPVTLTTPSGSAPFLYQCGTGVNAEILTCSAASTSSITIASPYVRLSHAGGAALKQVQAPFTHFFATLNGGGANGQSSTAQPVTHTLTHYNGLQPNATFNPSFTGYRQYAYWCASGMDFAMDNNNLFQHQTKGTSFIGADNTNATGIVNSQSDAGAVPDWRFAVGIGGPASGGTLVNNIEQASVSPVRQLTGKYALANQQNPVIIGRLGLSATGRLTYIAQDESPLLTMLAGTQQQLQLAMSYTPAGGTLQGITFNFSRAQFEAAQLADPDMMAYDVGFRALMNTTDVGMSGARGMMTVTLTNAVASY